MLKIFLLVSFLTSFDQIKTKRMSISQRQSVSLVINMYYLTTSSSRNLNIVVNVHYLSAWEQLLLTHAINETNSPRAVEYTPPSLRPHLYQRLDQLHQSAGYWSWGVQTLGFERKTSSQESLKREILMTVFMMLRFLKLYCFKYQQNTTIYIWTSFSDPTFKIQKAARLAQSVEHETLNLRVVGSSPTLGAIFFLQNNYFRII